MLMMGGLGAWLRRGVGTRDPPQPMQQTIHASFLPARPALRTDWRIVGVRIAGGFIVLLGLITVARGILPMSAHMGH